MTSQEPRSAGNSESRPGGDASQDLSSTHVTHVREDVAMAGRCANVHLPTGRTCTLPVRHPGSCSFVGPEDADIAAAH